MKKISLLLALACAISLFGCAKPEPVHTHMFGEWAVVEAATCLKEGSRTRQCTGCEFAETETLPVTDHDFGESHICKTCRYVKFDADSDFVELGVITDEWYGKGALANHAWDVKLWDGKVYRAAGDYNRHYGTTRFLAYNIATQTWEVTGFASEDALHSFVEIGGNLCAPGIDPTSGWDLGNYYVLKDGKWEQVRNLPDGIHNFKMVESNGKIFAGLGTPWIAKPVVMSTDGGKTFDIVPLYKDGEPLDVSQYTSSRAYDFIVHNNDVYALIYFEMKVGGIYNLFRYEDGKMVYVTNGYKLALGASVSKNYIGGNFDFNGTCYVTSNYLYAITDFSDSEKYSYIPMPKNETVADAFVKDGTIYVLTLKRSTDHQHKLVGYKTAIYTSTTGEAGSFTELLSFEYASKPISFDFDGTYFYIGTGDGLEKEKVGMVLRVKTPT